MSETQNSVGLRGAHKIDGFSIFPGTQPATPEQLANEVQKLFDAIQVGDYDLVLDDSELD